MNVYRVTVAARKIEDMEPGAFQSFINEIEFDLIDNTETHEVYEVRSEHNMDNDFNKSDRILSYQRYQQ